VAKPKRVCFGFFTSGGSNTYV